MKMKEYKWILAKPSTGKRLKIYIAENELKSSDEALNRLLDKVAK
jgi:hypothetical protein